jgi:hypothetical protein
VLFWILLTGASRAYLSLWEAAFRGGQRRELPDRLEQEVTELIETFREESRHGYPVASLSRAFAIIERVNVTIRWDAGLRDTLALIVMKSVDNAERRFGKGTGRFKRGFVIDVVLRIIGRYLGQDVPFPRVVEDVLRPIVGIFVDWTVEIFNIHRGSEWYPRDKQARLPLRFRSWGTFLKILWRVAVFLRQVQIVIADVLFYPSRYERELRATVAQLAPEVAQLQALLPPSSLGSSVTQVVELLEELGRLTLPHLRTVERLVRFARAHGVELSDRDTRYEVLTRVVQELLSEAYEDNRLALSLIQSGLGHFIINELIRGTEFILTRSGLMPDRHGRLPATTRRDASYG